MSFQGDIFLSLTSYSNFDSKKQYANTFQYLILVFY
jgi:hypothetical protein